MFAGAMDAVGGGGGLVTVPALLAAGLPPHLALGTNKGQSVFGSFAALSRYAHAGLVDRKAAGFAFPLAVAGSAGGVALALAIRPEVLRPLVLVLLVAAAVVVVSVRPSEERRAAAPSERRADWIWAGAALGIGAYDGFFGPGTGTFLILVLVTLLHRTLTRATADAKVVNFGSNLAAVALFASRGSVLWSLALPMAGAQLLGGFLGAHLAVRQGDRFIRAVVVLVVLGLVVKVARDLLAPGSR
ncbi:MAG TPA: TSUP family transporter [Candidatus Binatia bacterium]|nr:TSUP family transporter [Candidatus Binatia bacterium]